MKTKEISLVVIGLLLLSVGITLLFVGGLNYIVEALPAWFVKDYFGFVESIPIILIASGVVILVLDYRGQHPKNISRVAPPGKPKGSSP